MSACISPRERGGLRNAYQRTRNLSSAKFASTLRLLGHSSIATTEICSHVSDAALRVTLECADVLGTPATG
jgi:hypothetical protein